MKGHILCPRCREQGRKPKVLAKYEDVAGRGDVYLYCKVCKKEIRIRIEDLSIEG